IYIGALVPMLYLLGSIYGLIGLALSVLISLSLQSLFLWSANSVLNRRQKGLDGNTKRDNSDDKVR
ncbi:MAG: hypothetical protein ACE5KA_05970, partial [Nitrososphaerales archaeon]